jgi:predicted Zn-dependent protease
MTKRIFSRAFPALLLAAIATIPAGCNYATSPATGRQFLSPVSEQQEASLGAQEHPKILAEFGGQYAEKPNLTAYINQIGGTVAAKAERTDVQYTFTVLNTEEINAFALPGGYVYITRGLLALGNNEAEIAGVLGHEIGHINARHTAARMGQQQMVSVLSTLGVLAGTALGGDTVGQLATGLAQQGGAVYLGQYSQEQEFEADSLGVRYLARASYDPQAMSSFLDSLNNDTHLEAKLAGNAAAADAYSMTQSHPRTPDRVQRAIAEANVPVANPVVNRDRYLQQIDGLLWGPDPREGVVDGRTFIHPGMRFAFDAPPGFTLKNMPDAVIGQSDNAVMQFDMAPTAPGGSLVDYVASGWLPDARVESVQAFQVNGKEAAAGLAQGVVGNTAVAVRLVAVRQDAGTVFRFMFGAPPRGFAALDDDFMASAQSLRTISAEQAGQYRPHRIRVVTVQPGDTVQSLTARMEVPQAKDEWFRVINHLPAGGTLQAGQLVKIIAEDNGGSASLPLKDDDTAADLPRPDLSVEASVIDD